MRFIILTAFIVLLSLLVPIYTPLGQTQQIDILVIYSIQEERDAFADFFSDLPVNLDFMSAEEESPGSFSSYELIVIVDSVGEIEGEIRTALEQFISLTSYKSLLAVTSKIDQFSGDLRRFLGVESFIKELGDQSSGWVFNITGNPVSYVGEIGLMIPTADSKVLGRIISTNDSEIQSEISGNEPIVVERNLTTSYSLSMIFDFSTTNDSNDSSENGLALNGFSDLLREKVRNLIINSYNLIISAISNPGVETTESLNAPTNDTTNTNQDGPTIFPSFSTPSPAVFAALFLGLIALSLQKIIAFLRWLSEKIWALLIFIVASIYQPENRQLTEGQLLMNPARRAILEYLEHMGPSGAHLREIKNAVDVGMGNLLRHLEILEDYGWVEKRKIGRYNVYIASEFIPDFDENLKAAELELRSKHSIAFLEYLLSSDHLDTNISQISKEIDVNRKSVRTMLKTLKKYNLIWPDPSDKDRLKFNYESLEIILYSLLKSSQFSQHGSNSTINIRRIQ